MVKIVLFILLIIFSASCVAAQQEKTFLTEKGTNIKKERTDVYKEGELLVRFKEVISEEDIRAINKEKGAEIVEFIKGIRIFRLKIITNKSVEEMVRIYSLDPRVEYAEPNYIQKPMGGSVK